MIDKDTIAKLEFDKVLSSIASYCYSEEATNRIINIMPCEQYEQALYNLDKTNGAVKLMDKYNVYPSFRIKDISRLIKEAKKGISLTISELYDIMSFIKLAGRVYTQIISYEGKDDEIKPIIDIVAMLESFTDLEKRLVKSLKNESELNDDASEQLKNIRAGIAKAKSKINSRLKQYISNENYKQYLQDSIIAIRDNRYVIPLKVEYKERIKGIVHDQSNSGATIFIEPLDVLELNNELRTYELMEIEEIKAILQELSGVIGVYAEPLDSTYELIIELDIIFSKGQYSIHNRCVKPNLNNYGIIDIIGGRHPLIDRKVAVPNSIKIGKNYNILMISGPNAGGKTVAMKMVGLFTLMSMSGIFLPVLESANINFFNKVYADIGDEQSILKELSTFSSHMLNIANIVKNVDSDTLVLLDELGGGTEPTEGAALAIAITEYIIEKGGRGIITTHYNNIKAYSTLSNNIENASMDYDSVRNKPTYKLLIGNAGSSNALNIAREYKIPAIIIEKAKNYLNEEVINYEKAIKLTEEKNRELIELVEKAKAKEQQITKNLKEIEDKNNLINERLDKLNTSSKQIIKSKVDDYIDRAEDIIIEMKELLKDSSESNVIKLNHLKKTLNEDISIEYDASVKYEFIDGDIKINDWVFVDKLNERARVIAIKGNNIEVKAGAINTFLKLDEVKKISYIEKENSNSAIARHKSAAPLEIKSVSTELKIIGKTVQEAMVEVEKFIDNCVKSGIKSVRIVHGKGTFALKNAVAELLKNNPYVSEYRAGLYGEGELGVTVVTFV